MVAAAGAGTGRLMPRASLDPRVWVVWLAVAFGIITLARNPLYSLLALAAVEWVVRRWAAGPAPLPVGRLALSVLLFSTLFNTLFARVGTTALLRLPAEWPIVGGAMTLEAAVQGFSNGLLLVALLSAFIAFNRIVSVESMVRYFPHALRDAGIVLLIGLTYFPETLRHWQRVREAQALRGHQPRGWRGWRPLLIPLLVGGLERAMHLAEAMVARGYGPAPGTARPRRQRLWLSAALALLLAGWFAGMWWHPAGWAVAAAGGAATVWLSWRGGRDRPRITRYIQRAPGSADFIIAAALVAALLVVVFRPAAYSPYPRLTWPQIDPWVALASVALAVVVYPRRPNRAVS